MIIFNLFDQRGMCKLKGRAVFIPAILILAASIALIVYSIFGVSHHTPPSMTHGVPHPGPGPRERSANDGLFRNLGTLTVFLGAFSYAWLRLKTRRRSVSPFVRLLVRWFDRFHKYAGYAAIILIAVHGTYFLTQAAIKRETYTGLAAFALLLSLGIYGFLIRRVPNKHIRKIHFLLATVFAVAAFIHAGGTAILAGLGVVVFWGLLRLIERMVGITGQSTGDTTENPQRRISK